jgi:hypothetical protein
MKCRSRTQEGLGPASDGCGSYLCVMCGPARSLVHSKTEVAFFRFDLTSNWGTTCMHGLFRFCVKCRVEGNMWCVEIRRVTLSEWVGQLYGECQITSKSLSLTLEYLASVTACQRRRCSRVSGNADCRLSCHHVLSCICEVNCDCVCVCVCGGGEREQGPVVYQRRHRG